MGASATNNKKTRTSGVLKVLEKENMMGYQVYTIRTRPRGAKKDTTSADWPIQYWVAEKQDYRYVPSAPTQTANTFEELYAAVYGVLEIAHKYKMNTYSGVEGSGYIKDPEKRKQFTQKPLIMPDCVYDVQIKYGPCKSGKFHKNHNYGRHTTKQELRQLQITITFGHARED